MMYIADYAAAVVDIAGGQIAGKTRLQKVAYLLEAKELGNELDFDYRKFGPFSAEFAFAVDDAEALGFLEIDEKTGYGPTPCTVFKSLKNAPKFDEDTKRSERQEAVEIMEKHSATVLELAATAVYLKRNGYAESAWKEVENRKGIKATKDRLSSAMELVQDLQL